MMPEQGHFVRMMKAANVRKSQTVVVYDTGKGWFSSRAVFMLRTYGHTNAFILDGNFAKWVSEGRPVESDEGEETYDADFDYSMTGENIMSYERVKEVSQDGSIQVVDNRPGGFANGNITNSVHVPCNQLVKEDGTIKDADDIRNQFTSAGVDITKPIAFSCGGGITATIGYNAAMLANFAGPLYMYDGSWAEYRARKAQEEAEGSQ